MTADGPRPNNPLAPYYPSEVPDVPGSGRAWFALLVVLLLLFGGIYQVVLVLL